MDTSRSFAARGSDKPFVGRGPEQAVLADAWAATRAGRPRVVSVTGVPGAGKTRLVEHFVGTLPGDPTVVWLSADENEVDLQWEVLRQAVARLPSVATEESIRTPDPQANPVFVGESLAADLQRSAPAVLVVDDAHWADRASIEAIRYAARRTHSAPVLVVVIHHPAGAVRRIPDGRPNPGLPDGWRRMVESDRGVDLEVYGLAPDELMQLAAQTGRSGLSPAAAARLWRLTDGNPLHVRHLLPQLSMRTLAADSNPLPAPHSIAATIAAQLATCRAPTRELVSAAAVLGERFRLTDAAAVAELSGAAGGAAIAEALDVGLVAAVPGSGGREFLFADRLTRSSLYHDRALAHRQELHRRAALLGGPDALDHRLAAAAGGPDETLADDTERAARQRWRRGDLTVAAALFRSALELTPRGPLRSGRVLTAVEALIVAGDAAGAQDYESDVWAAPAGPWRDYVAGYQLLLAGRVADAKTQLESAVTAVRAGTGAGPGGPTLGDLHARVAAQLAIISILTLDYRQMSRYGEEAVGAPTTEAWVAAYAHFARAIGLALSGRSEEAIDALADADVPGAAGALDALCARGMIALWTDRLADADRDLRQAVARATAGEALRIGQAMGYLSEVEYRRGELDDAVLHSELALGDAEENLRVWDFAILHSLACYPRAARGEWAAAESHVRAAAHWAGLISAGSGYAYAAGGLAAIAQAKDDPAALLAAATDIERHYDSQEPGTHLFGPLRADALAQLGRPDEADEALEAYLARLARPDRRSALLGVARVRARIALARGRAEEALTECADALALATEVGLPLEVTRITLLTAHCLAALDRPAPAVAALRGALRQASALGATAYVVQATDAARALGLSIETPEAVFAGLTATERGIARLIGVNRTNKQVAAELSLSVKTVEGHLTAIYRKLGVEGRIELRDLVTRSSVG